MREHVEVWGPATVANWGSGYDLMGAAVEGLGDRVEARREAGTGKVQMVDITGDQGRLPRDPDKNTAGIAARETLRLAGCDNVDIHLTLHKGLPLGSGMGSSASSAAAAAWAVNVLLDEPLSRPALLPALLEAEAAVSGWHADNAAPSLLGGFVFIQSYEPLELIPLPAPDDLWLSLVKPDMALETRRAREVVPRIISLEQHIRAGGFLGGLVAGICQGDTPRIGRAVQDNIVEPARAPLLPGFVQVQRAALDAGAYGCSISGAGPTVFAVSDSQAKASAIAARMQETFQESASLNSTSHVAQIDNRGACEI